MGELLPDGHEQLFWDMGGSSQAEEPSGRPPEVFLAFGREMIRRMATSSEYMNSKAAIELAFQSVLDDFGHDLPADTLDCLLGYLLDEMPGQVEDYQKAGDPYYLAATTSFGADIAIDRIVRPIPDLDEAYGKIVAESEHPQLSLDDEFGQAA